MNAVTPIIFASAYKQLRPAEKQFVDGYVGAVEREAALMGERISNALYRPVPAAVVEASRGMFDKPMVRAAISERINEIAMQSELTVHRVIRELRAIAFASHGDYMTIGEDGFPYYDFTKCTPEQLSAIKKIKMENLPRGGQKFEHELHDKLRAIELLGKYMGIFETDNPHWRSDNAKPINAAPLPANVTDDGAADAYARMING